MKLLRNSVIGLVLATSTLALSMQTAVAAKDKVLATVNGKNVTETMFDTYVAFRSKGAPYNGTDEEKKAILQELINVEVMAQYAIAQKIDQNADRKAEMEFQKKRLLTTMVVSDFLAANPVTDAIVKEQYDSKFAKANTEYKARHILVKTEEEAKKVIGLLDKGGDFAELAKEHSTGPTGAKGGDLGWFQANQMVKEFGDELQKMAKGKHSKAPVKTQFGWHIILREDSREATPPSYEQVSSQLKQALTQKAVKDYLDDRKSKAKIVIK